MNIIESVLNPPEKYWVIIQGIHLHKGGIGIVCICIGLIFMLSKKMFCKKNNFMKHAYNFFIGIGLAFILLKIIAHFYIGKPELCLDLKAMFFEGMKY